MNVEIFSLPYDSGHRGVRMGAGPERLLQAGLDRNLRVAGHGVTEEWIEAPDGLHTEIGTSFELYRRLSARMHGAVEAGRFPIILAGNCGSALGTVSGMGQERTGVIWFDAHGDFNTPETSPSGFLDGMALAILTGACWKTLAAAIPFFHPIPPNHVVHVSA